ncbi:LytTR family two component transcriptional regulator [Chitinophaga niastensis]|uniref:LytTR family two component transcriptional regulator n=1 Tax=Chitinophaga niastensis TaxID=536980 RepID=A0A2P8HT54_CHINA|nr:LytTR family DNA-binding domain-containing protein [Chitinophaga niastensis]PSL49406.1 LytTR family two component transcriptional regulator [Chitinophaga niastensis]
MEQRIKCLVVDDEPFAREIMETYIARLPYLELVAFCENAFDATDILQQHTVDLLFSDIQMPRINGVEMIRSLPNPPLVVFATAFPEYAIEGFELDVVDYLVKPFPFDRFLKAVTKAKNILHQKKEESAKQQAAAHLFVKDNFKLTKVLFDDIYYVEGMKDYVKLVTKQKNIVTYMRMKNLEAILPSDRFIRIHKSYIVQANAIKAIMGNSAELVNNESIIIAKQYKQQLNKILGIAGAGDESK